jgi:hypothetical protein
MGMALRRMEGDDVPKYILIVGDEAWPKVREFKPDLITLDIIMARETGVKFYRKLCKDPQLQGSGGRLQRRHRLQRPLCPRPSHVGQAFGLRGETDRHRVVVEDREGRDWVATRSNEGLRLCASCPLHNAARPAALTRL